MIFHEICINKKVTKLYFSTFKFVYHVIKLATIFPYLMQKKKIANHVAMSNEFTCEFLQIRPFLKPKFKTAR